MQTPAKSSASANPANRVDHLPNLVVSRKTAAKIKEISPPQPSVAQITTNFCFQSVPPKFVQREAINRPAAIDIRMEIGEGIRVI